MSDLAVRDHSQPCEHGYTGVSHAVDANNVVVSSPQGFNWCPGGREIVLRMVPWRVVTEWKADDIEVPWGITLERGECVAEAMGVECIDGLVEVDIPGAFNPAYGASVGLAGCGNPDHHKGVDE